jgi:hypothetical protein
MFVPQVDGNVIDNDDTKVVNMLLESNPQLKNVSRARAVKILKNRFPDYFLGDNMKLVWSKFAKIKKIQKLTCTKITI